MGANQGAGPSSDGDLPAQPHGGRGQRDESAQVPKRTVTFGQCPAQPPPVEARRPALYERTTEAPLAQATGVPGGGRPRPLVQPMLETDQGGVRRNAPAEPLERDAQLLGLVGDRASRADAAGDQQRDSQSDD